MADPNGSFDSKFGTRNIIFPVFTCFSTRPFSYLESKAKSRMDSDAFSEDSDESGADVRQIRLAHSDDSSEDEDYSRDEPETISDAEVRSYKILLSV